MPLRGSPVPGTSAPINSSGPISPVTGLRAMRAPFEVTGRYRTGAAPASKRSVTKDADRPDP